MTDIDVYDLRSHCQRDIGVYDPLQGPVLAWLNCVEAFQKSGIELPVNLKFIFEGMEESGSEGLDDAINAKKDTSFIQVTLLLPHVNHLFPLPLAISISTLPSTSLSTSLSLFPPLSPYLLSLSLSLSPLPLSPSSPSLPPPLPSVTPSSLLSSLSFTLGEGRREEKREKMRGRERERAREGWDEEREGEEWKI